MTLFVYVTEQCISDAEAHSLQSEVERFKDRVEGTQSTSLFDPFPPPYLVKKKLGGRQGRLIADFRPMGDHAVIVFLAILIRGSRAYEDEFARDPLEFGKHHFADLVSADEIARFLEERTRVAPTPPKPAPSEPEYGLLFGAFAHHQDSSAEDLVCESKLWVEGVGQDRIAKQLALFCKPCIHALSLTPGLHFVGVDGKPGWGIWALRSESRLFLIVPSTDTTAQAAEKEARALAEKLEGQDSTTILQASRRAYPALVLADDELWLDLERDPHANMALSPEESDVLESARRKPDPFPLFISGRAGSGKSTILQYLFADLLFYCLSKLETRAMAPPIYLTANGELLRVARSFVERMLKSEATFAQEDGARLVEENRDLLDEAFREFQPHLLSLVPAEVRTTRFARSARVDYARFRRMWIERFGRDQRAYREFGPDLSWHIVRSYIKGMSSETYLEPEDYAQLPENQLTVTQEAFRLVYDRVWTGWYERELQDKGLWDDQDLTRYVLDHDLAKRIYPAVFCDEAQDFTRIELELLLRLNLFSDRTLQSSDISRVPFAFAGDQFQTLNPTGFRWDSIKASFVEKFIYELDPSRRSGRTDLNFRELKYNYRSTHKIVRFCNHVQALRAALFQLADVRPQIPWTSEPRSFPVVWFRANDAAFWKSFRQNSDFVVIIPCNEGEERAFVEADPVLREHIQIEDGVPVNVLSAARAKGREYPAVLVYGFGAQSDTHVMSELTPAKTAAQNPDRSLPLQYFINRLYVAVSRPKSRLVIVDTDEGLERLWESSRDETSEQKVLARIKNGREIWGGDMEGMTVGKADEITREIAADPLENARAFEADGLARHDAFLLKQAAQAYRSGGDMAKARECRARALEADGQLFDAGEAYFESGFPVPDGLRCLWRSGRNGWTRLCELFQQHPQIQTEIEFQWAKTVTQNPRPDEIVDVIGRFARRLDDNAFADSCIGDPLWRDALDALLSPLFDKDGQPSAKDHLRQLVGNLDKIRAKGIKLPARPSAHIFNLGQRYPEAIALWEESGDTKLQDYLRAKASVEPYPQRILTLHRLGLVDEVLNSYNTSPDTPLNSEQAATVADALRAGKRLADAYNLAWTSGAAAAMLRVSLAAYRDGDRQLATSALHAGLVLLVRQAQWETLATFATSLEFAPTTEWKEEEVKDWVESETEGLQVLLVKAVGRSAELSDAPVHLQRQLSDFLRRYLRLKGGTWRSHISITEAGAAFERGGRFTDAISFYEAVVKEKASKEDKQFARERWLMCKQRQLEHERSQGNASKINAVESELRQAKQAMQLKNLHDLPAFPELPDLPRPSPGLARPIEVPVLPPATEDQPARSPPPATGGTLPDQVPMQFGAFKVVLSRKNGRCNIEHTESMETAFLKIKERKCGGGDVEFASDVDGRWTCEAWKLAVTFPESPDLPISLSLQDLGVEVHFHA